MGNLLVDSDDGILVGIKLGFFEGIIVENVVGNKDGDNVDKPV